MEKKSMDALVSYDELSFINTIELEDIPWERLICTNGRALHIPKLLQELSTLDPQVASKALRDLSLEIEHQATLWTVAPFALIFIGRCGDQLQAVDEPQRLKLQQLQVDLSEYFQELLEICHEFLSSSYSDPAKIFSSWAEFFKDEHLLPPLNSASDAASEAEDDGEEDDYADDVDWESDLPDSPELLASCYAYSQRILEHYLSTWQTSLDA